MSLQDVLEILQIFIEQEKPNYNLTPEGYTHLLRLANLKQLKIKVGLPEEYQPGMPLPRQAFEITKKITTDVSVFEVSMGEKTVPPLMVDIYGHAVTPTNMFYPSTMQYKYVKSGGAVKYKNVTIVTNQEWNRKLSSAIEYPTLKKPIANFQSGYVRFFPISVQYIDFVYLRYPVEPYYAYEITKGYNKYDSAKSVQLEWNEINQIDIISIILLLIGINIKRGDIIQLADKMRKEGV